MKAIILARVSTEEQKEAGNSLPAQQSRLLRYIDRAFSKTDETKLILDKEFVFDETAFKEHRKEFDKVIKYISSLKNVVAFCCDKVDRLTRDFLVGLPVLERLRREGKIELHFPSDNLILHQNSPATDLFHFNVAVSLSQYFSNSISDNVKRVFENKVKLGEITGKAPIGYLNERDIATEKALVVVDKLRARFVVRIFELYSTGNHSMKSLANLMKEQGMTTKVGGSINVRQIELILKNPFYYGYQNYKEELYPHKYDPLISYDLFKKCQDIKNGYKKTPRKVTEKPFIFQGLMTCSRCGCRITPELHKGKYVYYHCTDHKGVCSKDYVSQDELLEQVKGFLRSIVLNDEEKDSLVESLRATEEGKNDFYKMQLKQLRIEQGRIEERIRVMYLDRLDGRITIDMYDKYFKECEEKRMEVTMKIMQLSDCDKKYYITANTILSLAQRAPQIFESSEIEEKRQILNFVFLNLQLDGKKLVFKAKTPLAEVSAYSDHHEWGD